MMTTTPARLILILSLLARPALADDHLPTTTPEPRNELRFNAGMFSAVGFLGVTYTFAPLRQLLLEAGVGMGLSGVQVSFMPRVALGSRADRFIAGAGVSAGIALEVHGE